MRKLSANKIGTLVHFDGNTRRTIRVTSIHNQPWFIAEDVCKALGYADPAEAVRKYVDFDDRTAVRITKGRVSRKATVISAYGLVVLATRSERPTADAFRRWAFSEAIPRIRQYGVMTQARAVELACWPDFIILLIEALLEERAKRLEAKEDTLLVQQLPEEEIPETDGETLVHAEVEVMEDWD